MEMIIRLRKSLKMLLVIMALLFVACLMWLSLGFYLTKNNYNQTYKNMPVYDVLTVNRDEHAIPVIEAKNKHDAILGLGFIHAQDRYWQMMMMREAAKGRLSAYFGADSLDHDRLIKTLDLEGLAADIYAKQSNEVKERLQAYSDGVNAWINLHEKQWMPLTPEGVVFSVKFDKWKPEDSILVEKLFNFDFSNKVEQSLMTMWMMQHLTKVQLDSILPGLPSPKQQPWPAIDFATPKVFNKDTRGSNVFSIIGSRLPQNKSILASDPHMFWSAPSYWMLVSMKWGDQYVSGGSIPGMPVVLIGRNENLAWGVTMTGIDDQDLNFVKVDEDNNYYLNDHTQHVLKAKEITIPVKNQADFHETILMTDTGPIIDPNLYGFKIDPTNDYRLTLQWTASNTDDYFYEFEWALMDAKNANDYRDAMKKSVVPIANLVVTDKASSNMHMMGRLINRDPNHPTQGRYPGDYADVRTHWRGVMPFSDSPDIAPKSGIILNTNNRITAQPFPKNITFNWIDYYRIRRGQELLFKTNKLNYHKAKDTQLDITSYKAKWLNALLLYHLDANAVDNKYQPVLKALQAWQGNMLDHRFEPLLYHEWLRLFKKQIIEPVVHEHARDVDTLNPTLVEKILKDPMLKKAWCKSDCRQEVKIAFDAAINHLEDQFGEDYEGWQWARLHHAKHKHLTLGDVPIVNLFANIVHPISGDEDTLALAKSSDYDPQPYIANRGSGLRMIVDFSDPNDTINMISSTGQSGHLLSRFYRDQNRIWRFGDYIKFNPNTTTAKYTTVLNKN